MEFAGGRRVKAFSGIERSARLKLDRLEAAASIRDLAALPGKDTALRLGHFFGTSAQFWLNLQSLYDLRLAEEKTGKSIRTLPRLKRHEMAHAEG